jgi:hypothetical protein
VCLYVILPDPILHELGLLKRDPTFSLIELFVDQMEFLDLIGLTVHDAYAGEDVKLYGKLLMVISDIRGHQDVWKCSCTPAFFGCLKCWFKVFK